MVGAGYFVMVDGYMPLRAEFIDEFLHSVRVDDFVLRTLDDDARRRAGREEAEIVHIGGRRDRDETADFGATHQQLHPDPRAKTETCYPCRRCFGVKALHPIECCRRIGQFADAIVEFTFATANAAEIEAQHGKAAVYEGFVKLLCNPVVHGAAGLRMRVKDHRNGCARAWWWRKTGFKTAFWAGNCYGWHYFFDSNF